MANTDNLGEFEQLILLAILRLGDEAYGVAIRTEISKHAGRTVTPGAMYTALDRLEMKGLIKSRMGEPTPQRGGRQKRYVTVTASGIQAVTRAQKAYQRLLDGLEILGGSHA